MKTMKIVCSAMLAFVIGLATLSAVRTQAASPSVGATVTEHKVPVDGAGVVFSQDWNLGWKVWNQSNPGTTASLVLDEYSNAPSCGVVNKVCVSPGAATSETVLIYDSAAIASAYNSAATSTIQLMPAWNADTAKMTCSPVMNLQFNRGLLISNSASDLFSTVYWRPCRGGRN